MARNPEGGEAITFPWEGLAQFATPRRAQVAMLYGPAGSCKSMFALNFVLEKQLPTIYVSPDTDAHDMTMRVLARKYGVTMDTIEESVAAGAMNAEEHLADVASWLQFTFDPAPTTGEIDLDLRAFNEQFGADPEIVVVDTLSDVGVLDEDEFRGFRKTMADMHIIARDTGAFVMVLHHTTGEFDGREQPAPRYGINGKLSKVPELILSCARSGNHFGVAIVKQRQGFQDPLAQTPVWLSCDPAKATITDRIEPTTPSYAHLGPDWT